MAKDIMAYSLLLPYFFERGSLEPPPPPPNLFN